MLRRWKIELYEKWNSFRYLSHELLPCCEVDEMLDRLPFFSFLQLFLQQLYPHVYVDGLTSLNCVNYGKFIGIISPWLMNVFCTLLTTRSVCKIFHFSFFYTSKINLPRTSKCNNLRCKQKSTSWSTRRNISSVNSIGASRQTWKIIKICASLLDYLSRSSWFWFSRFLLFIMLKMTIIK